MFGDQFQSLDIIIGTIRCLSSTFLLMKIQFLEKSIEIPNYFNLESRHLQNLDKFITRKSSIDIV